MFHCEKRYVVVLHPAQRQRWKKNPSCGAGGALQLSDDGLEVVVVGGGAGGPPRFCHVSAELGSPDPAESNGCCFYYEVRIVAKAPNSVILIGMQNGGGESFHYRSNGAFGFNELGPDPICRPFSCVADFAAETRDFGRYAAGVGDVVGLGLCLRDESQFFTLNGQRINLMHFVMGSTEGFVPVLGVFQQGSSTDPAGGGGGVKLQTNFGGDQSKPFMTGAASSAVSIHGPR